MSLKGTILITGGLGFIGPHLTNRLVGLDEVEKIIIVDRRTSPSLASDLIEPSDKISIETFDIQDEDRLAKTAKHCSVIFHLAAESHVQNSIVDPRSFIDSNIIGTFSVLEAARKHQTRMVLASTSEVYGSVEGLDIDENHPLEPYSPYAATKIAADRLVAAYARTYSTEATIVRMFNAFGPGQYYEKLVPMFICSALCGLPFPVQGDGSAIRDWSYVDDMCTRLIQFICPSSPLLCNLGSGESRSVNAIATDVARLAGLGRPQFERLPERQGHMATQSSPGEEIAERFGSTETSFDIGLSKTFNWYRDNIDSWKQAFLNERPIITEQMAAAA